jgi:hypothetical protein
MSRNHGREYAQPRSNHEPQSKSQSSTLIGKDLSMQLLRRGYRFVCFTSRFTG